MSDKGIQIWGFLSLYECFNSCATHDGQRRICTNISKNYVTCQGTIVIDIHVCVTVLKWRACFKTTNIWG